VIYCCTFEEKTMQLKVSSQEGYCPFCFHTEYIETVKLPSRRKRCACRCGYTWIKESWMEMMSRTGKVWIGHKYDSDSLE